MTEHTLRTVIDQAVNGLVIGNIYALIAVGLAFIFGVAHLINFAHGSVFMIGSYVGWLCVTRLGLPLFASFAAVALVCAILGILIERICVRPFQGRTRIAPLIATIGVSFVLDQLVQIVFTPDPHAFPNPLPPGRFPVGGTSVGWLDILIAAISIASGLLLYAFLRYTRLGWSVRATVQDRDAAQQMGVNVDGVNTLVFVIASILGGIGGVLVGIYFNSVDPNMGLLVVGKGFTANLMGGLGNIPGAIAGSLLLGLVESFGVAIFGSTYRNLFAFVILFLVLVLRPGGLFSAKRVLPPEPMTGSFVAFSRPARIPWPLIAAVAVIAVGLPLALDNAYVLQVLTSGWLFAILALSLTLVAGTAGQMSLALAGLLTIGGYSVGLLMLRLGIPFELALPGAAITTAGLGTLLILPAFKLRGQYVTIATIGIGEIVNQVILNGGDLTNGPLGLTNIPPPTFFGPPLDTVQGIYWLSLALLIAVALLQVRLVRSHLGRSWRAIREDEVAAQSYGINLNRYKALAFAMGGFIAGISGAVTASMYSYMSYATFTAATSNLALTMVTLGGMGNIAGAIVGAVALIGLPEIFRGLVELRYLIYGIVLVLLIRFRPQGLLGTV
jgi:branched-chain amino acid transport system permease protein